MQLKPEQLEQQLKKHGVQRCYLVSGDEALIVQECADAIRAAARAAGCIEREVIEITSAGDWQALLQSGGAMSLFAERKLIEVRLPSGKPGTEGSKAIVAYLAMDTDDILLVVAGKIDRQSQKSKWYTGLDTAGAVITVWPIGANELPRWLTQRLKSAGLEADREAVQMLAERVEGNLLAAAQEVEKLKLLVTGNQVTAQTVMETVLDNARYNTFGLVDTALAGDARGALRTLRGLQAESTQPPVVLWTLVRDIKLLATLAEDQRRGVPIMQAMNQHGVWRTRTALIQSALQRHTVSSLARLQSLAYTVDGSVKGFAQGDPWDHLERMVAELALGAQC